MAITKQELFRQKLQTKMFDVIGKTVTLKSKDSPTYNTRGDELDTTYTESSVVIVPYNIVFNIQSYEIFGTLNSGELDYAISYTETVKVDDLVLIEGSDWRIKQIEPNYLPDNIVTIVRLTKVLP